MSKNLDISVSVTFRRVYVRWSLPISDSAQPDLIDVLYESLLGLNGVNYVEIYRYEAVLYVATHVCDPKDVAFDVFGVVFEPDGDVVGAILDAFDGYNLTEKL